AGAGCSDRVARARVSLFAMAAAHVRRDSAAASAHAEQAIALSSEQRVFGFVAIGFCGRGLARVQAGELTEGLAEILQGITVLRAGGAWTTLGYYLAYLAEAHLACGQVTE